MPGGLAQRDLDRKAAALSRALTRWVAVVSSAIDRSIDAAHAHAVKSLTDSLRKETEGRPTLRRAAGNPSAIAAESRLAELLTVLAGPSASATTGLIRDARESFYMEAFSRWLAILPPDVRKAGDPSPPAAGVRAARTWPLHGTDSRAELAAPVGRAVRALKVTIARAGGRAVEPSVGPDLLKAWAARSKRAIGSTARLMLSDSLIFCDRFAGRSAARADLLNDDPSLPDLS